MPAAPKKTSKKTDNSKPAKKTTLEELSVTKKKTVTKPPSLKKEEPAKEVADTATGASQETSEQSLASTQREGAETTEEVLKTEEKVAAAPTNVPEVATGSETASDSEIRDEPPLERSDEQALPPLERSDKKLFAFGLTIFVLTVLATSGVFLFFIQSGKNVKKEVAVTEEKTTPTPTPTPATLKREEWSLDVLNGSGVAGVAKKTADKLSALGYVIKNTGNADKSDYATTQILVSSSKTISVTATFLADMKKELGVGSSSGDLTDSKADAQIIVGTDNAQ